MATPFIALAVSTARGFSLDEFGFPWIAALPLTLLAAALSRAVTPDPLSIAKNIKEYYGDDVEDPATSMNGARSLREAISPPIAAAFAASATAQGIMVAYMVLSSLVMHAYHIGISLISLAVTLHVIGMFALAIPLGRAADRWGRTPIIALGTLTAGIGALLTPISGDFYLMAFGLFLVGLGWSAATAGSTALISDYTAAGERGKVLGANDAVMAFSALTLPFASGLVIEAAGPWGLALFGLASSIPATAITLIPRAKPVYLPRG